MADVMGAPTPRIVRVGNASGYWGDDPRALERQVLGSAPPEFITSDFLAEITMSILQKQRARRPEAGYARDFVTQIAPLLTAIRERGITVITNAGGVHPEACAEAVFEAAAAAGVSLTVAVVTGDDLLDRVDALRAAGAELAHLETGEPLASRPGGALSANAYLGAEPVVRALAHAPDVVITGRVTDTGITLAALRHAFGWDPEDWDRIAQGPRGGTSDRVRGCRPPGATSPTGSGRRGSRGRGFRSSKWRRTALSRSPGSRAPEVWCRFRSPASSFSTSSATRLVTSRPTRRWISPGSAPTPTVPTGCGSPAPEARRRRRISR